MKSFFNILSNSSYKVETSQNFWDKSIPPKVLAFCWIVKQQKTLTIDNLRKRNHVIVNGCPLCLRDEKSVNHLLIHCPFAYSVWIVLINLFDVNWVMPKTVEDLFL